MQEGWVVRRVDVDFEADQVAMAAVGDGVMDVLLPSPLSVVDGHAVSVGNRCFRCKGNTWIDDATGRVLAAEHRWPRPRRPL